MTVQLVVATVFFACCFIGSFVAGYYLLPWLLQGVSPRETWRRDLER
jgi:hypothetical protein